MPTTDFETTLEKQREETARMIVDAMVKAEKFIRHLDKAPRLPKTERETARILRLVHALRPMRDP